MDYHYKLDDILKYNKIVICEEYQSKNGEDISRRFFAVNSYIDLGKLILDNKENGHFYEVIKGNQMQKIFFDLDMEISELGTINPYDVLESLIESVIKLGVNKNSILVCETQCNLKKKYSFHVIILRAVLTCDHARRFAEMTIEQMHQDYSKFIDKSVYSKNRQLRLVWSSKLRTNSSIENPKIKKINEEYSSCKFYQFEIFNILMTLITNIDGLELFSIEIKEKKIKKYDLIFKDHHYSDIQALIPDYATFERQEENFVILKRICPSFCVVCQRIHHYENPYLIIREDGFVELCCRRSHERVVISKLDGVEVIELVEDNVEDSDLEETPDEENAFIKEISSHFEPLYQRP